MSAKQFLIDKGITSMGQSINVLVVQAWLTEYLKYTADKINRVEIISKDKGREIVRRSNDFRFSLQDEETTLKIFHGYDKNSTK